MQVLWSGIALAHASRPESRRRKGPPCPFVKRAGPAHFGPAPPVTGRELKEAGHRSTPLLEPGPGAGSKTESLDNASSRRQKFTLWTFLTVGRHRACGTLDANESRLYLLHAVFMSVPKLGHYRRDRRMKFIALMFLFFSMNAFGMDARPADALLGDLTRCDRKFFETLHQQRDEFAHVYHFRNAPPISYFAVPNRADPDRSLREFNTPIKFGAFEVIGYFDEVLAIGDSVFLSWGFVLQATPAEIAAATRPLIWENERLRKDAHVFVRTEMWEHKNASRGWVNALTVADKIAAAGTVERVFLIEPFGEHAGFTRFGCSLQGSITPDIIRTERPDLRAR